MIKRYDRTQQLMRQVEEVTGDALKTAALKLKAIAQQMVSRKYTRKPGANRTAAQQAAFEARRKIQARKYFLSLPPKRKKPQQEEVVQ